MAVELASGYVSLSVKLDGATKGLGNLFDKAQKQALDAGKKTGEAYTKGLEAEYKKANDQVSKFAASQKKALDKEADYAGKTRVALEKLNEARNKGVTGSRLTQLQTQHESLMRKEASAASELARETDALTQAQKRQERAQSALSGNVNQKKPSGFLSRWRKSGKDSGQAFNDAASKALGNGSVSRAASDAGGRVKAGFLRSIGSAAALAAPFVGVGSILTAGFSRLESIDAAKAKLTALGNSAATVDTIMNSALESVKGTSYGLGDAATIAASATAAGIKPGQELTKYLGTTADAAAIAGTSLSDMGRIFNQVQTGQKAYTEDLNQLAERGIPIYQWVADEAGVAAADVKKMASEGQISSETFFKAVEKNVGGAAKTIGETSFSGAIENLKAGIGRLGATILGPVFEKIPGIVRDLTPTFDRLGESIKPVVESIVNGLGPTIQKIVDLFQRWKGVILPLVTALVAYKSTVLVISAVTKAWAVVQGIINGLLLANPIGLVIAAIAALVAGIVLLYKNNETFRNIVQGAWAAIKVAIGAVWNWIKDTVVPGLKAAWDAIAAGATWLWQNALSPAWEGIKAVIGLAWEIVSDIFQNFIRVGKLVGEGAMWLWNNAIGPAWEGIKTAISAAWDFVSPIFDKFLSGWNTLKDGFITGAKAIGDGVRTAFNGLAGVIKAPLKGLGVLLSGIPTSVFGFEIPGASTLNSWGQSLQGLARGGVVRGPGTGTSDSVLAWLSNGEGVVTADAMGNGGSAVVSALNAGWVPPPDLLHAMIPGFANGGVVGAIQFAQQFGDGRKYLYGGVGPTGFDCSGYMSAIYGVITGQDPFKRYFTTESNFEALGFQPGYQEGAFNIGIRRGGGGPNSHMAGTLPNGVNVESGGSHGSTEYGGDAAGALDFPIKYYLPLSGNPLGGVTGSSNFGGGGGSWGGGGSTGATKAATPKQLREAGDRVTDLENRLDIAQQELTEVEANPKAKDTTKQKKRDSVEKLKRDLQQAKDDKAELESRVDSPGSSSGGKNSGSDPFSKILDGFSELANTAVGGIKESFLPEGFSDPTQWGLLQAGGGLLNFFSGLTPDPVARGILGAFGSGLTGDAGGAVKAIGGIFQPQQGLNADVQGGALAPGAGLMPPGADQHSGTGAMPGPQLPGVTVNANAANAQQVGSIVNEQYQPAVRRQFATARNGK
ncbi:tape measure protein [Mycobacterium sp. CnD-18-1]|uniref:tape measure protein n=1 Tax=Mycobacterium sp. CnD-18-1 TaxID=2917744 RepID=UPI001EF265B0|nr:tape measure protein [Mycobacterium sp. CnD-18-1]MCG7607084.1 tape measure protein [Mycobacterium sp. CnD-18-1]